MGVRVGAREGGGSGREGRGAEINFNNLRDWQIAVFCCDLQSLAVFSGGLARDYEIRGFLWQWQRVSSAVFVYFLIPRAARWLKREVE